jgi:predicted permease
MVISHRFWERQFRLDPAAIGKTFDVGGTPFTIIGVTPAGFSGTQDVGHSPDFSIPLGMANRIGDAGPKFTDTMKTEPWVWPVMLMGRMKPGVSFDQVRADLQGAFYLSALEGRDRNPQTRSSDLMPDAPLLKVAAGGQGLTESRQLLARALMIMAAIVGVVLAIVCSNLAMLLLARGAARRREIAVRLALGAGRLRLVRQLLTESMLLAVAGAGLALLLALSGKDLVLVWMSRISPSFAVQPPLDLRVFGFTAAVTLLAGILAGLAPALVTTRMEINPAIARGGREASGSGWLVQKALLVPQVALSVVLLVGAGLFVRSLRNLETADVGFNTQNLLIFKAIPRWDRHPRAQLANLYEQVMERIQAVPGVLAVSNSQWPLLSGDLPMPFIWVPGHVRQPGEDPTVYEQKIWPNFFETMGMPLVMGRNVNLRDAQRWRSGGAYVAVVNETLARRYFPGDNPIGRRVAMTKDVTLQPVPDSELIEIIGVVRDAKYTSVRQAIPPTLFLPFEPGPVIFEARTAGSPTALISSLQEAVKQVDPDLRLTGFTTQSQQAGLTFARERHFALLSSLFGLLALVLVCIGLYGILSYSVANRTREIGIRVAVGARPGAVVRMIMRNILLPVSLGMVIGIVAALSATRLIGSMLYGLAPGDPATIAIAVVLILAVAAVAGYLPARRASQVDPMAALPCE